MSENKDVAHSQPEPVLAAVVDFETLSIENDAVIPSFGVVFGDLVTGVIDRELYVEFDVQQQIESGRRIDASTLAFWLKQDHTARLQLAAILDQPEARVSFEQGMAQLTSFLKRLPKRTRVVGNGPTFDLSIILKHTGMAKSPYPFWEERSLRDWRDLCMLLTNTDPAKEHKFVGVKHNGLDDARNEFAIMSKALNRMRGTTMERLMREMPVMTLNVPEDQQAEFKELIESQMTGASVQLMPSGTPAAELKTVEVAAPLFVEYREPDLPETLEHRDDALKHFEFIANCVHRGDMAEIINAQAGYVPIQVIPEWMWPTWVFNGEESAKFNKRYALRYTKVPQGQKHDTLFIVEAWNEASVLRWMDRKFGLAELSEDSGLRLSEIIRADFDYSELVTDDDAKPAADDGIDHWLQTKRAIEAFVNIGNLTDVVAELAAYSRTNEVPVDRLPTYCRSTLAANSEAYLLRFTGSNLLEAVPLFWIRACGIEEAYAWLESNLKFKDSAAKKLLIEAVGREESWNVLDLRHPAKGSSE